MYEISGFVDKFKIQNCINATENSVPYLYGMSAEKLNIQNFVNSAGNCVPYICTTSLDFRKIEYPELCKFNVKLCTLYVRMSGFAEKF